MPERWAEAVGRWSRMNAVFRRNGFPDANSEYFLYQTLVGAWPIGIDRLGPYMLKAAREAKVHTSWTNPDPVFEEALQRFVEGVLGHAEFTADLSAFLNAHGQAGDDHLPGPDPHQVHRPGHSGYLPGEPISGTSAWWTRTTAGRWISIIACICWAGLRPCP